MIRIDITQSGIAHIGKKGFQDVGRHAVSITGHYWWTTFLPLHFSNIAYLRYKYAARDKRTNKLKRDRKPWPFGEHTQEAIGEVKPLVFSGRTRERVLSRANVRAKAPTYDRYRAEVILDAPALNFSAGSRINLRDEITRDNPNEIATLGRVFFEEWNTKLTAQGFVAPKRRKKFSA